jgi:hypothetical protein
LSVRQCRGGGGGGGGGESWVSPMSSGAACIRTLVVLRGGWQPYSCMPYRTRCRLRLHTHVQGYLSDSQRRTKSWQTYCTCSTRTQSHQTQMSRRAARR